MAVTYAEALAAMEGWCTVCGQLGGHDPNCPDAFHRAKGDERCSGCRRGLDAGETYWPVAGQPLTTGADMGGVACLECAFTREVAV